MQLPGPTLIVTEGDTVSVTLKNNLPVPPATRRSCSRDSRSQRRAASTGLLAQEAANGGGTVTYTFVADQPGHVAYYSGTHARPADRDGHVRRAHRASQDAAGVPHKRSNRDPSTAVLAPAAYDHASTCYDREYMFQFSEMDSRIHDAALGAGQRLHDGAVPQLIAAVIEPYHPNYFLINGRSMPDDMDSTYSPAYPHQPYNGTRTCIRASSC